MWSGKTPHALHNKREIWNETKTKYPGKGNLRRSLMHDARKVTDATKLNPNALGNVIREEPKCTTKHRCKIKRNWKEIPLERYSEKKPRALHRKEEIWSETKTKYYRKSNLKTTPMHYARKVKDEPKLKQNVTGKVLREEAPCATHKKWKMRRNWNEIPPRR